MPTKKPRLQTIVEPETYNKVKYLCEKDMRSESQMLSLIISKYIEEYEQKNGEICISDTDK